MPIYRVEDTAVPSAPVRLVRASNRAQARTHVVNSRFACDVATPDEVAQLFRANRSNPDFDVEDAGAEPDVDRGTSNDDDHTNTNAGTAAPAITTSAAQPPLNIE